MLFNEDRLKPCPFCGGKFKIQIRDDEGNIRDYNYRLNSFSGIKYSIQHSYEENEGCPIAAFDDEHVGVCLYHSVDELVKFCNKRYRKK